MWISGKSWDVHVITPEDATGVCTLRGEGFCLVLNVSPEDLEILRHMMPVEVFLEVRKRGEG